MKTAFATLCLVAAALDSEATEVSFAACTDSAPTTSLGCNDATYTTIDDNSVLSWKWMINSTSKTGVYTSVKTGYAYCNYLNLLYNPTDATQAANRTQSMVNCGLYSSATSITESLSTFDAPLSATADTYSHFYRSTSSFLGGLANEQTTSIWIQDAANPFKVNMDANNKYIMWSGCASRPFVDSTVALTAGESINVSTSQYIWTNAANSSTNRKIWGQKNAAQAVTVLDAAEEVVGATALAAASMAVVAALAF